MWNAVCRGMILIVGLQAVNSTKFVKWNVISYLNLAHI